MNQASSQIEHGAVNVVLLPPRPGRCLPETHQGGDIVAVATGRDALPRDPAPHVQRRCKRKNRRANWKSLSSDSARAGSQKQLKEAWRHAAPDARERIPIS